MILSLLRDFFQVYYKSVRKKYSYQKYRGNFVNEKLYRPIKYFLVFFSLGLAFYAMVNTYILPSQFIISDNNTSQSISKVAARVSPSVVGISNLQNQGSMFAERNSETTGSGVIIDNNGHIVTNNHVIKDAQRLLVTLADGNEEEAILVGTDPRTDLAVLKIEVDNHVTPAQFGDSDKVSVGEDVIAIGNPLGLRFARSVTAGIVSGLNRLITTEEGYAARLIQTDAAINPGNSGGALVNLNGQVIGINTVKISVPGFEGMGFAIPSQQVKTVINDIIQNGKVKRPIMGIRILGEVSAQQASYFNIPIQEGVAVEPIQGGPAEKAGLKQYDIITMVNGEKVQTGVQLQETILKYKPGDIIEVSLSRLTKETEPVQEIKAHIQLEEEQ